MNDSRPLWPTPTQNNAPGARLGAGERTGAAVSARNSTHRYSLDARCLYIVHNGRTVKVLPVVEPGWRVIVEDGKAPAQKEAA